MKASDDPLEVEPVLDALPVGFDALRAEAVAEGSGRWNGSLRIGKQARHGSIGMARRCSPRA
jgi:hypothetical protein